MRWVHGLAWAAAIGIAAAAEAQETRARRGTPTTAVWREWDMPFELSAGKVFVEVRVNGEGPYPFVLDTGSPTAVVDLHLAEALGIALSTRGRIQGAGEGSTAAAMASGVTLDLGGITIPLDTVIAVAINDRLSPFNGRPIMGLIGNDFIMSRVVEIDYERSRLIIREGHGWKYDGEGVSIPVRVRGHTTVQGAITVNGERIPARLMVDTGAELGMSLTAPFVEKHRLMDRAEPAIKATVGFGLGGEVRHAVCRLERVEIGAAAVEAPVCTLSADKRGALAMSTWDGLIGAGILSRYRVIFDGPGRRMILEPGPNAEAPLEFDMSGLALMAREGPDGPLMVLRVLEGSPADEAGVRGGDEMVAFEGWRPTGRDRDRVRALLRQDGAERRLRLKRDGEEREVRIRLRRMVRVNPLPPPRASA